MGSLLVVGHNIPPLRGIRVVDSCIMPRRIRQSWSTGRSREHSRDHSRSATPTYRPRSRSPACLPAPRSRHELG
eukprot:gene19888-1013_t